MCIDYTLIRSYENELYNIHAPIRSVRIKYLPAPLLASQAKKIQKKRNIAKSKYKLNPNDSTRDKYLKIRNFCNRLCRDSHFIIRLYNHKFVAEEVELTKVWKFLKLLGAGKTT
ncbi:unnamed protein product [Euphydryas editha]|uniref:Uncharacterized protein n=1 Tax=Euphydryas editha TaxID=104508 RepID=A0AAU9VC53_EUPED|nr:unnamed protein product [Euphydryas editha]